MILLSDTEFPPSVRSLFPADLPTGVRCWAILNGEAVGRVLVDDPAYPTLAVLQEPAEGTIYLGGAVTPDLLAQAVTVLRQDQEVVLVLWPDDPLATARYPFSAPKPAYLGAMIDFCDRDPQVDLKPMAVPPPGCELQRMDLELLASTDHSYELRTYGSLEKALEKGLGFCLLQEGAVVSRAFAGPSANGMIELGVGTDDKHRRKGFATVTCARLITACEALGYQTFWNAAAQNAASIGLARKLGYRTEKPARVYWWKREMIDAI